MLNDRYSLALRHVVPENSVGDESVHALERRHFSEVSLFVHATIGLAWGVILGHPRTMSLPPCLQAYVGFSKQA